MKKHILLFSAFCFAGLFANAQTTLPTSWNFSTPSIATPPTGWILANTLPASTGGQTYAFGIGDAISCRFDATGEYLTINFTDKPGTLTYYVSPQNAGNTWIGVFDVQESDNGSVWTAVRQFTSWPNTTTNYTNGKCTDNNLKSTSRFLRFMLSTKTSGNFGLDSVLLKQSPPPITPTLNLKQGTLSLINNSTFVVGNSATKQFTLENKGTQQTLNISSFTISGANASEFSINNMPDSVGATSSENFTLNFSSPSSGSRFATLTINNNDVDKNPFVLNLYAIAGNYASEPIVQPSDFTFLNVKAYGFNAKFSNASTKPEAYLVLRKKGSAITDAPLDGQSYMRGDYIGNSQVAYIGIDTAFKPSYIFSSSQYYFKVFALNGPAGFENYLISNPLSGNITTTGSNIGNYYSGINSSNSNFLTQLSAKINPHDTVYYSQYISKMTDVILTRDTSAGKKVVSCVYTGHHYIYSEPFQWANGANGATLTREHTYAQSWMPTSSISTWPDNGSGKEFPEYNDLHNLFPAHQINANARRSNYPFGEVVNATYTSPTGFGKLGTDKNGITVWEPRNEHKGDLARALFYMATCYNGISSNNWKLIANQSDSLLLKWHFEDLPDSWEIARHEFINSLQHNRNPFTDSPQFALRINFKNMTYLPNSGNSPALAVVEPTGSSIWVENKTQTVKWQTQNVDTINIYFSQDSAKTFSVLSSNIPSNKDSLTIQVPAILFANSYGIVKIEDKKTGMSASSVYFLCGKTTSLKELLSENLKLYPNPNSGDFIIQSESKSDLLIEVFDITGKTIFSRKTTQEKTEINIGKAGFYIVKISDENHSILKKVIVE